MGNSFMDAQDKIFCVQVLPTISENIFGKISVSHNEDKLIRSQVSFQHKSPTANI